MTGARLFANVIGAALIAGFLAALFVLFIVPIPTANEQIITYMIGQLSGFAGGIIAYHYASKAGDTRAQEIDAEKTANTGKALDAVTAAIAATPADRPKGTPDDPLSTEEVA